MSLLRRLRLPLMAFAVCVMYACVYPLGIELSGDQTAQVVAAESLLHEDSYKVSLHESYGPAVVVDIGADLRQPLRWYPPGYSVALFVLARAGLSLAGAALVIFFLAKFIWALSWLTVGIAYDIPFLLFAFAVAFSILLTYPSTTTEILESISIALFFLSISRWLPPSRSAWLTSTSIAVGTFFRFAAVKLLGFYGLVEWIRRPRISTCFKVVLVAIAPMAVYLACTRLIGGESTPYHGVGPGQSTNWSLLLKGIYYAATGGWSPNFLALKILVLVIVSLAAIGFLRVWKDRSFPEWIVLLVGFQVYYMVFLIVTQVLYGSMYAASRPAFATPRFFALTEPLNVAALLFLVPLSLPEFSLVLRRASALILVVCVLDWVVWNHRTMAGMIQGPDGFLRFADVAAVHSLLRSEHPDGIFDGTGVFVYTAADPRIIYPDDVRGIRSHNQARIAVVRFAALQNDLIDEIKKQIAPDRVAQFDRFEIEFFTIPAGFDLKLQTRPGFVPHV